MHSFPTQYVEQTGSLRRPLIMWLVAAIGMVVLVGLILGAPLALSSGHAFAALTIYRSFSYVCHQIPERSFFIAGHPFAVCSRCTGLYVGFAAATLVYPLLRSLRVTTTPARKWLFLAAAPLAIDFSLGYFGIWENTHSSRFLTGLLLGSVAVIFVMPGLMDLSLRRWRKAEPATHKNNLRTPVFSAASAPSDYSAPHRRI
jgi:uncharacterized membrane protein